MLDLVVSFMKNNYVLKWVLQRVTALFLIPLSFWFIYNCICFQNYNHQELQIFFSSFFNSFLFLFMMVSMLWHGKLGCETIVQDYVSNFSLRKISKNLINIITIIMLFLVFLAIIKLNIYS